MGNACRRASSLLPRLPSRGYEPSLGCEFGSGFGCGSGFGRQWCPEAGSESCEARTLHPFGCSEAARAGAAGAR
jgi:hypothetical protein